MSIFFFTVGLEIIGIISGSIISAVLGLIVLGLWGRSPKKTEQA